MKKIILLVLPWVIQLIITIFAILLICGNAFAFTSEQAERCIVGEAASEGFEGMVAVGEAIRNRMTLKGVYGCKSDLYDREPQWVRDKAKDAWEASATSNLVKGADHWENVKAFGKPYWADSMELKATVGNHNFYGGAK